jgi:tetratricopeptide (TPR) repeat protein
MTISEAFSLAVQRTQAGDLRQAEAIYRRILLQEPAQFETRLNLGTLLHETGRFADAMAVYRMGLALDGAQAELWSNLGSSLTAAGELEQAISACRQALAINPRSPSAHNNLGNALKARTELPEAKAHFQQAIALRPDFAFAHNNLGAILYSQDDLPGAAASIRRALELNPDYPDALLNLGNVLCDLGQWQEAIALCRRAIALRPDSPSAHWNLGLMLLRLADFQNGWAEYEWRWRIKDLIIPRWEFPQPLWNGQPLGGKKILLHLEQGYGDAIQFMRYAPLVAARGGRVVLYAHPALAKLFRTTPAVEQVVPWDQPVPAFDVHFPLLSLPRLFATDLSNIPAGTPYLTADPKLKSAWQARLNATIGLKIGLAWEGRPTHVAMFRRSIPLAALSPLAEFPEVQLISLQKGLAARQVARLDFPIIDWTNELNDFADTAALIDGLDLVITGDTAVAHLAGALGKPVWLLLPFVPDWRWLLDRADSPWYPTMRIFRQNTGRDWHSPIAEVLAALRSL